MKPLDYAPLDKKPPRWKTVWRIGDAGGIVGVLTLWILVLAFVTRLWLLFWVSIVALVILGAHSLLSSRDKFQKSSRSISVFAVKNGFEAGSWPGLVYRSFLFGRGLRQLQSDYVVGNRGGFTFKSFTHSFVTIANKESTRVRIRVVEIDLGKQFPHLFIDSKLNDTSMDGTVRPIYATSQKLKVNQAFNKHFDVYIPKEYEIEGLDVFSVDLMSAMLDSGMLFDLEVIGDKLILYLPRQHTMSDHDVIHSQFEVYDALIALLKPKVSVWQFSEIPRTSYILEDSYDESRARSDRIASLIVYGIWIVLLGVAAFIVYVIFSALFPANDPFANNLLVYFLRVAQ